MNPITVDHGPDDRRRNDRSTLAAFYIFGGSLVLALIYFIAMLMLM